VIQRLLGHVLEQVGSDPHRGCIIHRFRNQGRDRLACLMGERDKQVFLFRLQFKRVVSIHSPYKSAVHLQGIVRE